MKKSVEAQVNVKSNQKHYKSDNSNQTNRLLTKAQRDLIAEYHRHHPLSKLFFCPDCLGSAGIPSEWGRSA